MVHSGVFRVLCTVPATIFSACYFYEQGFQWEHSWVAQSCKSYAIPCCHLQGVEQELLDQIGQPRAPGPLRVSFSLLPNLHEPQVSAVEEIVAEAPGPGPESGGAVRGHGWGSDLPKHSGSHHMESYCLPQPTNTKERDQKAAGQAPGPGQQVPPPPQQQSRQQYKGELGISIPDHGYCQPLSMPLCMDIA
ncbi:Frizzled-1 [Sigmodon hispidus]